MKLIKISASGLKGGSFSYEIKPVSVLCGPFGSGKTRVLDAIQLALLSYVPRLGKRPGDSFRLASGEAMKVKAVFDNGTVRDLRWERENGSVKFTGPKDASVPAVLLDYREFFALTGPERLGMLASKMDVEKLGFNTLRIGDRVLEIVGKECASMNLEDLSALRMELAKKADELEKDREAEGVSVQEWLETFLGKVQEKLKAANDAVKQLTGAARTNVQLSGVGGSVPRDTSAEIAAAEGELQKCRELRQQFETLAKQIEQKRGEETRLTSSVGAVADKQASAEEIGAKIKALEKIVSNWEPNDIREQVGLAQGRVLEVQRKVEETNQEIDSAIKEHESNLSLSHCPFCKHAGKDWKKEIIKAFKKKLAALEAERERLWAVAPAAKASLDELQKKSAALYKKYEASQAAHAELKKLRPVLEKVSKDLASVTENKTRLDAIIEEKRKLENLFVAGRADNDAALTQLSTLNSTLSTLKAERDRWISMKSEEKTQARAQTQLRTETDRAAVFKVAVKALQGIQGELIARSMVALLEPANKLTAGFLPGPFEYQDGDFGYRSKEGQWVSHSTFCGTEAAVAYAGLSVALAQESQCKIVLLDGLDIDPAGKQALYIRLVELVKAGVLDQVVATDVTRVCDTVDGVTVIKLERGAK